MIGTKIPPPWVIYPQQYADEHREYTVYKHPDGRFGIGVEKGLRRKLSGRGEQGHIIVGFVADYIEAPTLQSCLDRAWLVQNALWEIEGKKAESERVIDEMVAPAPKRILRRKRG